jgi:hypothetical protein
MSIPVFRLQNDGKDIVKIWTWGLE